tara:strand:+ start:137 stop:544 length:408 start_codon:yes stop_codon:yes gene_type:complete
MNAQRLRAISDYQDVAATKTDTKDPHELVKLLFEGLTDRIALARSALAKNDREGRAEAVTKAQKILFGLRDSLDFDKGGELAINLDSLYEYSIRRLVKAHAREDDSIFREVMDLMVTIRDAWKQIPTEHKMGSVQ